MRKPRNIARYSPVLAVAALMTVTILELGLAPAQAQVVTPSWTAATALPTLHANGKIAFTSDRDGSQEIYLMNPDGTNQTTLTNNSIVDDHAMWSPNGKKLAFVSQRAAGGFAIFQMNMDGTNRVEITPLSNFLNGPPYGAVGFSMSWSPDGRKIAFQDPYYNDIWVVDVETHARQNRQMTAERKVGSSIINLPGPQTVRRSCFPAGDITVSAQVCMP
jgi:Tol biopolymer transport system component